MNVLSTAAVRRLLWSLQSVVCLGTDRCPKGSSRHIMRVSGGLNSSQSLSFPLVSAQWSRPAHTVTHTVVPRLPVNSLLCLTRLSIASLQTTPLLPLGRSHSKPHTLTSPLNSLLPCPVPLAFSLLLCYVSTPISVVCADATVATPVSQHVGRLPLVDSVLR